MGLFNRNKKEKKIKWFINKQPGNVELEEAFIKLTINLTKVETILFYKDIHDIKKGKKFIKLTSKTDEYTIAIISNGETIIDETYIKLLEKISGYK